MALALEHTVLWLRERYGWKPNECATAYDAMPLPDSGQFFVGVDDGGVEVGNDSTGALTEVLTLTVGIWRRPEHLAARGLRSRLKLPTDKYLLGAATVHDLERRVIVCRGPADPECRLDGLHQNPRFVVELNQRYGLPDKDLGDKFTNQLFYRGRGRMENPSVDLDGNNSQAWYGYRLRFRGLTRIQRTNSPYVIG